MSLEAPIGSQAIKYSYTLYESTNVNVNVSNLKFQHYIHSCIHDRIHHMA